MAGHSWAINGSCVVNQLLHDTKGPVLGHHFQTSIPQAEISWQPNHGRTLAIHHWIISDKTVMAYYWDLDNGPNMAYLWQASIRVPSHFRYWAII